MDVPFTSSGAFSRALYTFVRKVEGSASLSEIDQHILSEIEAISHQLADPALSLKQCKEFLVILLYCAMNISAPPLGGMEFALPHAVHLAESGLSTQDKRLGYQFCSATMPKNHELQLMLVNTIRKDLESSQVPRICLALETLINSPFEGVIPAVQSRLYDLLSHNSADVRRRALAAIRSLSRQENSLLINAADKVVKRLKDPQPIVISASLSAAVELRNSRHASSGKIAKVVNSLVPPSWDPSLDRSEYWFLLRVLGALRIFGPSEDNLKLVMRIIEWAVHLNPIPYALLYQAFTVLSIEQSSITSTVRSSPQSSPILPIRTLINSTDPNEQYLAVSCIKCLDVAAWAGTTPEVPGVLDSWEVERIMKLLGSPDAAIRHKTLGILAAIDANIVEVYYSQILQNIPDTSFVDEVNESAERALEVIDTLTTDDGKTYATRLQTTLAAYEGQSESIVLERVVEKVLTKLRTSEAEFRATCLNTLLEPLLDPAFGAQVGATWMVILTALLVEYLSIITLASMQLLYGLAGRLSTYPSSVKDACLLAMIRLSAECEEVPVEITEPVRVLSERSGRYIRRRCEQFVILSAQKEIVQLAVAQAKSSSLPDFLVSLEATITSPSVHPASSRPISPPNTRTSRSTLSASKLRYDAYEPPRPHPRLLPRSSSSTRSVTSSEHGRRTPSVIGSPRSERSAPLQGGDDPLARTVTAGDLALVAGDPDLARVAREPNSERVINQSNVPVLLVDAEFPRSDLITLESPFMSEPGHIMASSGDDPDFETIWNIMEQSNSRGWCEESIDTVVRRLQGLRLTMRVIAADQPPFEGDFKILLSTEARLLGGPFQGAVLRLRESDDESCLWRLRCDDVELRTRLKRFLTE